MNNMVAFVLGLLIGWLLEWIIDWAYWRRRQSRMQAELTRLKSRLASVEEESTAFRQRVETCESERQALQEKLAQLETENAALRDQLAGMQAEQAAPVRTGETWQVASGGVPGAQPTRRDNLQQIKGIGPVIAGLLNQAGIHTFKDLGAITPDRLREIVGDAIERLADEDSIIQQARQLADEGERGG